MNTVILRSWQTGAAEIAEPSGPYGGVRGHLRPRYASRLIGDRQETIIGVRKVYQRLTRLQIIFENQLFAARVIRSPPKCPNQPETRQNPG